MIRFLDFDRTLFDTDAFKEYLLTRADTREIIATDENGLARELDMRATAGALAFAPGELAPFVYPDAPEYLRAAGNEAVIVTFGNPALQKVKIESALAGIPRVSVLYTGDEMKGPYMRERYERYGSSPLFVDDTPLQLASLAEECPKLSLYEMRRDGGKGDGRWPVIHTLSDLP